MSTFYGSLEKYPTPIFVKKINDSIIHLSSVALNIFTNNNSKNYHSDQV